MENTFSNTESDEPRSKKNVTKNNNQDNVAYVAASTPPRSPNIVPKRGGTASLPSSPRQLKSSSGAPPPSYTTTLKMPSTSNKPPRSHHSDDISGQVGVSPSVSPSSVSISSKATIRTGTAGSLSQQMNSNRHSGTEQQQQSSSGQVFDYSGEQTSGNISKSQLFGNRTSGIASPKMSPAAPASKKKLEPLSSASPPLPSYSKKSSFSQQSSHFFSKLDHPPLPLPRKASKCPLFCCFYAEFDNVVGPKICFESPQGFMEQSTDVSLGKIHKLLGTNFDRILAETVSSVSKKRSEYQREEDEKDEKVTNASPPSRDSHETKTSHNTNTEDPTTTTSRSDDNKSNEAVSAPLSPDESTGLHQSIKGAKSGDSAGTLLVANTTANASGIHKPRNTIPDSIGGSTHHSTSASGNTKDSSNPIGSGGGTGGSFTSIFDSTSDFIITGNELTGNIVNLSAFNMHLVTRPTVIHDKRYERNSLLFCVGFVLRRTEDPRPFRPLLSKLALTLKRMEMESHFLSKHSSRQQLQPLLDRILVSLNCTHWETNLVVHNNVLNLKLFHPPKYPSAPVPDHAVPILLRRDWQVQMYDWDLAINWVVLHIDGIANARQISKKAEVDMEMVRNCLRVLKHHGVISVVDMFFYSNRYESTTRAASMLAGHEIALLQEAAEYVIKRPQINSGISIQATAPTPYSNLMMGQSPTASPTLQERYVHPPVTVGASPGSPIPSSFPPEFENATAAVSSSLLGSSLKFNNPAFASYQSHDPHIMFGSLRREEQKELKAALAELYCAFNRDLNFGDLWVALAAGGKQRSQSVDRSAERSRAGAVHGGEDAYQHQSKTGGSNSNRATSYSRADSAEMSGSEGTEEQTADLFPKEYLIDRLRKKTTCASIDFSAIFDMFDHRRFVSFGLVNGLLKRVHNYPVLLDPCSNIQTGRDFSRENRMPFDDDSRLARDVARMMDGMHCDDHIVSVFEKPINELMGLVERTKRTTVMPIYSTK